MSKARELMKKLRKQKEDEEKIKQPSSLSADKRNIKGSGKKNVQKRLSTFSAQKRRPSYIDPLEFFAKERLHVQPGNMDEYKIRKEEILKEVDEEEKKEEREKQAEKEAEKEAENQGLGKRTQRMTSVKKIGGMLGVKAGNINFAEMMKARQKIGERKALSQAARHKKMDEQDEKDIGTNKDKDKEKRDSRTLNIEEEKNESDDYMKKRRGTKQQHELLVKLAMARNKYRFNTLKDRKTVYKQVSKLIREFNSLDDMPEDLQKEKNILLSKIGIGQRMVTDPDCQFSGFPDSVEENDEVNVPLEEILSKMNLKSDM